MKWTGVYQLSNHYAAISPDEAILIRSAIYNALIYLKDEEQTQLEREQASALTKEPLDPCSSRLQKERIKDDIDQNNC